MDIYEKKKALRPKINRDNGNIDNIEQIVQLLKLDEDTDFIKSYLDELNSYVKDFPGRINETSEKALFNALNLRLAEIKEHNLSNQYVLNVLKETNPNLKSLTIIETSKENTDSKRAMQYIKFVHENGEVELLECFSNTTLKDYLDSHPDFGVDGNAKDLFDYYKEYVHKEVSLVNSESKEDVKHLHEMNNSELEKESASAELDMVKNYALENHLVEQIKIGINERGERLFTVGATVIMFRNNDHKRELYVVDKEHTEAKEAEINRKEGNNMENDNQEEAPILTYYEFTSLLNELYSGNSIGKEKTSAMEVYARKLIGKMQANDISFDDQNAIDCYIEYLKEQSPLSSLEEDIISEYDNEVNKKKMSELAREKEANDQKVLTLQKIDSKGAITTITILEVTVALGMLVSILAIALK